MSGNNWKIISLFFFLAYVLFFASAPLNIALNFAHEDSFYYLKIAKNFSEGYFSTFDKVSRTNGYHPLYLILISVYFSLLTYIDITGPEALYRFTCMIHAILAFFSLFLAVKAVKKGRKHLGNIEILLFILTAFFSVFINDFGTETHVTCFLFSVYLYVKFVTEEYNKNRILFNAVIIGLVFLTRIDYLITLIPAVLIAEYATALKNTKRFVLLSISSVIIGFSILYFSANYLYFGTIYTSSTAAISSFPGIVFSQNIEMLFSEKRYIISLTIKILIVFLIFVYYAIIKFRKMSRLEMTLFCALTGLIFNILVHLLFNKFNVREWYISAPLYFSIILLFTGTEFKRVNFSRILLLLVFACSVFVFTYTRLIPSKWESSFKYANILRINTKPADLIYQYDYSGAVSFFSERNIINGDGFVNTAEYVNKYLQRNDIKEYFVKMRIDYLSTVSFDSIMYDKNNSYIFSKDETFLKVFNLTPADLMLKSEFRFSKPAASKKGYWLLFKINKK